MVHSFEDKIPDVSRAVFIAWNAEVMGDVVMEEGSSVFFGAQLRGDTGPIRIGKNSNIQDNSVLHNSTGIPCVVGDHVTVGHNAILHSCTVEENCVIGMGAIILDQAVIQKDSIVGAGALVTGGKTFPPASLIIGSPAKAVRSLTTEEIEESRIHTARYVETAKRAAEASGRGTERS
ncbi:MAG: gamma carbonic anhydrase family protein [Spirochaetales bacterium]|nr:gamma carbonic anhydrase family protein [Spirochaetales bacterium]